MSAHPPLVVVTGVSGSGKTTVGRLLAERLGVPFADGDHFHDADNVEKMSGGTPLTDEDRGPWLDAVADWLEARRETGAVVACSALKRSYRDRIAASAPGVFFVQLDGSRELIAGRLEARRGHFMPHHLLDSQLAELQPLQPGENGARVPIDGDLATTVDRAAEAVRAA
ncbi:gluconokinase [Streptomyces polyrhachis]|uniref:Gluconokinase n=1 Tax=Streptomyces polyrhachis TaxID=1282885 RepID=A0ABW2GHC2_9ACTN